MSFNTTDYLLILLSCALFWEFNKTKGAVSVNGNYRLVQNFFLYVLVWLIQWSLVELGVFKLIEEVTFERYSLISYFEQIDDTTLLNASLFLIAFMLIDLLYYGIHRLFHHYRHLWCWHLVHHTDVQLDISSNFRHHPIEVLLVTLLGFLFFIVLPIDSKILLTYAYIALVIQVWHHSNFFLNKNIDKYLRIIIVTPSVHHIHHSPMKPFTNCNYGAIFTFWDRLFSSYCSPSHSVPKGVYGLEYFRQDHQTTLMLLYQPIVYLFKRNK